MSVFFCIPTSYSIFRHLSADQKTKWPYSESPPLWLEICILLIQPSMVQSYLTQNLKTSVSWILVLLLAWRKLRKKRPVSRPLRNCRRNWFGSWEWIEPIIHSIMKVKFGSWTSKGTSKIENETRWKKSDKKPYKGPGLISCKLACVLRIYVKWNRTDFSKANSLFLVRNQSIRRYDYD